MEGLLKALGIGFDTKPNYKEKIPDSLTTDCFNVHNYCMALRNLGYSFKTVPNFLKQHGLATTFKHGFVSQPLCLGYDSVQQLLAIGAEHGSVLLLGKPGLERHIQHPTDAAVTHLEFVTNRGLLVTGCDNNTLYLWNLKDKEPTAVHSVEFMSEKPTALSHVFGSGWMYVGTDAGNVHLLHLHTFKISGFAIHWNNAVELSCRHKPGDVISVQEHPLDQGKVLIAFSGGKCVLFDVKASAETGSHRDTRECHKRFNYDPGSDHILTSVSWLGSGKNFACSYSDGTIVIWNPKAEARPERVFPLHEIDPTAFKPIYKIQQIHTESDPWIVATGGYPEINDQAPRTITILRGKAHPRMLSTESTIVDFLCLPSSPYTSDCQRPFALVILTKRELVVHDLEHPEFPCYPNHLFPYALNIHLPAVTFLHYTANCSDEFIASLHSVKSKLIKTSAKPWPLKGGKWGEEVPHTSTDLIVTGHEDGSVKLWYCSSVCLQPFFAINTAQYFKMQYQPSLAGTTPALSINSTPPTSPMPSTRSPTPTKRHKKTLPVRATTPSVPVRPPPPITSRQVSCPAPQERTKPKESIPPKANEGTPEVPSIATIKEEEVRDDDRVAPSPASGNEAASSEDIDDSGPSNALDVEPAPERIKVNDKLLNHKRKSFFKKKKQSSKNISPQSSRGSSPVPDSGSDPSVKAEKKKSKSLKKSFKKMANVVRIGRSMSNEKERPPSAEEVDGKLLGSEGLAPTATGEGDKEQEVSLSPKRPDSILLEGGSPKKVMAMNSSPLQPLTMPIIQEPVRTPGSPPSESSTTKTVSTPLPSTLSVASTPAFYHSEDFFPITNIHLCAVGLWLSVANKGGAVMSFNFQLSEKNQSPKALEINFDWDSVIHQYHPSLSRPSATPLSPVGQWTFNNKPLNSSLGFQLCQVCTCYYHIQHKNAQHKREPKIRVPAKISVVLYCVDQGLLVIGTNRGFALVNTATSSCLHILSSLTSILYLCDPSKFTRQLRKESENQVAKPKPMVRRHSTRRALSSVISPHAKTPARSSEPNIAGLRIDDVLEDDCFDDKLMTVEELECSVTALELVQLQLDKEVPPTLVLWAGLASGHLVAYGVNITKRDNSTKIDLIPTKFIQEMKSPIVSVFFLNEWGDRQLIPYQRRRINLSGSPEGPSTPTKLKGGHYAIIASEDKISSFCFPGGTKLESCSLPRSDNCALLQSEYLTCNDLPCLLSLASNKDIFIHSLPGLRELLHIPFNTLSTTLAMCTFHVSGHGQGIFMSSDSEFQRLSTVKEDKLNLPACLPDLFVQTGDPGPYHGGVGKRILDALFTSGPVSVDREQLFGEAARRPVGNLYKLDGKVSTAYSGKKDRDREDQKRVREGKEGGNGAGGVAGQLHKNVQALNERKEKLSAIEERTAEVAQQAANFSDLAKKLRQKNEK